MRITKQEGRVLPTSPWQLAQVASLEQQPQLLLVLALDFLAPLLQTLALTSAKTKPHLAPVQAPLVQQQEVCLPSHSSSSNNSSKIPVSSNHSAQPPPPKTILSPLATPAACRGCLPTLLPLRLEDCLETLTQVLPLALAQESLVRLTLALGM